MLLYSPASKLFFDDCFLSEDRRIWREGGGLRDVMRWFDHTHVLLAAS